jgi:hypothetical protein
MKEWKRRGNSSKNSCNGCNAVNCPSHTNDWRNGNCEVGISFRGCEDYSKYIKGRFNNDKRN